MTLAKQKVLWVTRRHGDEPTEFTEAESRIADKLSKDFDLILEQGILRKHYEEPIASIVGRASPPFSALITHLEPNIRTRRYLMDTREDYFARSYAESMDVLWKIKKIGMDKSSRGFKIVAYTGVMYPELFEKVFISRDLIDSVVFKRRPEEWEKSYEELARAIE